MKEKMPVLFVGHGSPMNAIEDNEFTAAWEKLPDKIPVPSAILVISAHWYTSGTRTHDDVQPKTVYDMYGFPRKLYQMTYPAKGSPELARRTAKMLSVPVEIDNGWGFDHGAWSVLCRMYPKADIPIFQLSVDQDAPPEVHFRLGQELGALREEGVLIMGSGNVVHNLALVDWGMEGGFPWALEFDEYIKESILQRRFDDVVRFEKAGSPAKHAFYTPEHFYPLLYVLGASRQEDKVHVFNEGCLMGAMSMTGYLLGDML